MKPREPLNSNILKNKFPDVYREFFSKCQLVVSVPHFFTWAGEYVGYWGGMMVTQKIPFRIYVGLEFNSGSKNQSHIIIGDDAKSYSIQEDKFKYDQYDYWSQQRLIEFFNNYNFGKKGQDTKIHILSELPLETSGSSSALCSALAVLFALENKDIKPEEIESWKNFSSQELLKEKKLKFDFIFRSSWKIATAYREGYTSGAVVFTVLLPSLSPIFYCISNQKNIKLPLVIEDNYKILDEIPVLGGKIEELFKIKGITVWPIDFALASLGESRGAVPFSTRELQDSFIEINKFVNKDLKKFLGLKNRFIPSFCRNSDTWEANLQVANALNIRILIKLGELLESGVREDVLRAFLRTIDKHQTLFLLLGMNTPQINATDSFIHQEAFKIDDLGAGVKSTSTTRKGVLLFATPQGRMHQIIDSIRVRVKKELKLDFQIIYASWLDGIEQEGIKVEQDLRQEIYSEFISQDSIQVKDFSQKTPAYLLLSSEEFNKRKKQIDLLLSEEQGKIYIRGKTLNSKQLHSQKATINILKILLKNMDKEVSNKELPKSSYSNDRYELQGKIVAPLIKAVQEKTKKKLDLKVKGGVVDFSLKLNPGQVKIWLI